MTTPIGPEPTAESIAAALAYQRAEREKLWRDQGVLVGDAGHVVCLVNREAAADDTPPPVAPSDADDQA